ncbi:MAG: pirin family protein [Myxococcota bacterium]
MMQIRRSLERGFADHGWLRSFHTFSFADYLDPRHMGFRSLRVINEDRVAPSAGFPTHAHRDMEIISYVLSGALEHKDSIGSGGVIVPGDVQRMSAGSGVFHSEFNASARDPVHFLQIWLVPDARGIAPSYEQKAFQSEDKRGRLRVIASKNGREGSVTIHQDATLYAGLFDDGEEARYRLAPGRHAWVHVARGGLLVNDTHLEAGDAAAIEGGPDEVIRLAKGKDAEVLLFDLA